MSCGFVVGEVSVVVVVVDVIVVVDILSQVSISGGNEECIVVKGKSDSETIYPRPTNILYIYNG